MLRKILAVDDSALIHQMYKLFLSRYKNCKLVSAMNGLEALDKLGQEEGIDLILLDINMPVMNGLEFLQRVQKEPAYQAIPVIIISTEGKEEDTIRGLKMGAKGYVKKPFQASELHGLIEKITAGVAGGSTRRRHGVPGLPRAARPSTSRTRGCTSRPSTTACCPSSAKGSTAKSIAVHPGPAAHPQGEQRNDGLLGDQGLRPPPRGRACAASATAALALEPGRSSTASSRARRALRDAVEQACLDGERRPATCGAERPSWNGSLRDGVRAGRDARPPAVAAPTAPLAAPPPAAARPRRRRPRAAGGAAEAHASRPLEHGAGGLRRSSTTC